LNANRRRAVILTLVDHSRTARRVEQIRFGVRLAGTCYEYKIVSENAMHRLAMVLFHGSLVMTV
jgi:hypothetical protein